MSHDNCKDCKYFCGYVIGCEGYANFKISKNYQDQNKNNDCMYYEPVQEITPEVLSTLAALIIACVLWIVYLILTNFR